MAKKPAQGLPCNVDAERFVLGSILLKSELIERVNLTADDFALDSHRTIFRRMIDLRDESTVIDRMTVANELMRYAELDPVGGLSYLVALDDGMPDIPNIDSYVRIVKEKSILRQAIFVGQHMVNQGMEGVQSPQGLLQHASKRLAELEAESGSKSFFANPGEIIEEHGGLEKFASTAIDPGISFGYPQLDEDLMGLQPGCQYVIAGRTSSGKSSLAMNIAVKLAMREPADPVGVFSLEMTKEQLLTRAICSHAQVPLKAYLRKNLSDEQRAMVAHAVADLHSIPLYIDDTAGLTISELSHRIDQAVYKHNIRLFIIDHLHRINWVGERSTKYLNEYAGFTAASWMFCLKAQQHTRAGNKLSSMILCQLNRPADKKAQSAPPDLESLRATGAIEQDATGVIMLHRPEQFIPGRADLKGKAEAWIRKSRNGSTGRADLRFRSAWTTFYDEGKNAEPAYEED